MPIKSENLQTFSVTRNSKKDDGVEYIVYPRDMKDDRNKDLGQDRIEFTLKEHKKATDTRFLEIQGSEPSSTDLTSDEFPFPSVKDTTKEDDYFVPASININGKDIKTIYLPIQDKIVDVNSVDWGSGQLNDYQRRLANFAYNAMKGDGAEVSKALSDKALNDFFKDFGTVGRFYLTEQVLGTQNLLNRATGKMINSNLELLFQNTTLRPFTFNFRLSPRHKDEAEKVKSIIRFFKQGQAPRVQSNSVFLKTPYVFGIRYLKGSKTLHDGINLIKTCALQNCSVDYTPNNSYMTYSDGTMISYNINMTFSEIIPVYDIDYKDKDSHPIGY